MWNDTIRGNIRDNILDVGWEDVTPPRNRFIYNSGFWPFLDLFEPANSEPLVHAMRREGLNSEDDTFLLSLACNVAALAESLLFDLADAAPRIAEEVVRGNYRSAEWPGRNFLYHEFETTYRLLR
jgi:hypothetical protein